MDLYRKEQNGAGIGQEEMEALLRETENSHICGWTDI